MFNAEWSYKKKFKKKQKKSSSLTVSIKILFFLSEELISGVTGLLAQKDACDVTNKRIHQSTKMTFDEFLRGLSYVFQKLQFDFLF